VLEGRDDALPPAVSAECVQLSAVAVLKLAGLSQLYVFGEQNFVLSPSGK
jgi:hypothetical protein